MDEMLEGCRREFRFVGGEMHVCATCLAEQLTGCRDLLLGSLSESAPAWGEGGGGWGGGGIKPT